MINDLKKRYRDNDYNIRATKGMIKNPGIVRSESWSIPTGGVLNRYLHYNFLLPINRFYAILHIRVELIYYQSKYKSYNSYHHVNLLKELDLGLRFTF